VTLGDKPREPLIDLSGDESAAALRIWQLPAADGHYLLRARSAAGGRCTPPPAKWRASCARRRLA
jgi:hypothetical protein